MRQYNSTHFVKQIKTILNGIYETRIYSRHQTDQLCCERESKPGGNFIEAGRVSILNSELMPCGRENSGEQGQALGEWNLPGRHREQWVQIHGAMKPDGRC